MTQPIAWTRLWNARPETNVLEADFALEQREADETLWLTCEAYAANLDFHQATALRDALDGWLLRHAYMGAT